MTLGRKKAFHVKFYDRSTTSPGILHNIYFQNLKINCSSLTHRYTCWLFAQSAVGRKDEKRTLALLAGWKWQIQNLKIAAQPFPWNIWLGEKHSGRMTWQGLRGRAERVTWSFHAKVQTQTRALAHAREVRLFTFSLILSFILNKTRSHGCALCHVRPPML